MANLPTAPVAAGSLVAGYLTARETGIRPLGGVVLAGAARMVCGAPGASDAGTPTAGALLGVYAGAFVASHPLAKRVGAWPAVLAAAATSGAAALGARGSPPAQLSSARRI